MKRTVNGAVRIHAQRIFDAMIAIVPARRAQIEAADEGDLAVDDDEFLMMAGVVDGGAIETKLQAIVGRPVDIPLLKPLAVETVNEAEIPGEDEHAQLGGFFTEPVEKRQ